MNDAVITLNGLEKRFPGMDKPAVAPLDCTDACGSLQHARQNRRNIR